MCQAKNQELVETKKWHGSQKQLSNSKPFDWMANGQKLEKLFYSTI